MKRICKKDKVVVVKGGCKGSVGIVLKVLKKENRVVVEGVNKMLKNTKKNDDSGSNQIEKEMPIHISNVALADESNNKPIKIGFSVDKDGNKIRINRKTGKELPRSI